jgi:hypothetical protein
MEVQGVIHLGTAGECEYCAKWFVDERRIAVLLVKNTIPVRKAKATLTEFNLRFPLSVSSVQKELPVMCSRTSARISNKLSSSGEYYFREVLANSICFRFLSLFLTRFFAVASSLIHFL